MAPGPSVTTETGLSAETTLSSSVGPALYERYTHVEQIGSGAFGVVVSATERKSGLPTAVKVVRKKGMKRPSLKIGVGREIELLRTLRHPHIVQLRAVFEDPRFIYMAMELGSTGNLLQLLQNEGFEWSEVRSLEIFRQVMDAVAYLHSRGIVHKDVKLENVVVMNRAATTVKLIDFGLSHWRGSRPLQLKYRFVGTASCMSPEMLLKARLVPEQAEMWSCGVLLFSLLTNGSLVAPGTVSELKEMMRTFKLEPKLRCRALRKVSGGTIALLRALLHAEPAKRPTAAEAVHRIDCILHGRPPPATPGVGGKRANWEAHRMRWAQEAMFCEMTSSIASDADASAYLQRALSSAARDDTERIEAAAVHGIADGIAPLPKIDGVVTRAKKQFKTIEQLL